MNNNIFKGLIIKGVGGYYTVKINDDEMICKPRGIFRKDGIIPMVGDFVEVEDNVIIKIFERKNSLIRPMVANIDKLFIVVATKDPEPNIFNIDKMLTIAVFNDIKPIIILNKTDLPDLNHVADIYSNIGVDILYMSATNNQGIGQLQKEINGCTCALSGVSGVGKTSILNALDSSLSEKMGEISRKLMRGKHTTRHAELFKLPTGGFIIDTPGFSNLMLSDFNIKDRTKLAMCFPDFTEYHENCKFLNCSHIKEKGCAVLQALSENKIVRSRHESYIKMYEEIGVFKPWEDKKDEKNI